MPTITPTVAVTRAITAAKGLPGLIANLNAVQPGLAAQLETKPLIYSKTLYGPPLATTLAWVSTRYALGWDANTCALVSGLILFAAGAAFRAVTKQPIAGILTTPAGTPPAVPDVPPTV